MKNPKYQVFSGPDKQQLYFALRAKNGRVMLQGSVEGADKEKREARMTERIASIRASCGRDSNYINDQFGYDGGIEGQPEVMRYSFALYENQEYKLGQGPDYVRSRSTKRGIDSVKTNAPTKSVEGLDSPIETPRGLPNSYWPGELEGEE